MHMVYNELRIIYIYMFTFPVLNKIPANNNLNANKLSVPIPESAYNI